MMAILPAAHIVSPADNSPQRAFQNDPFMERAKGVAAGQAESVFFACFVGRFFLELSATD